MGNNLAIAIIISFRDVQELLIFIVSLMALMKADIC